jgi:predicted permease
VTSPIFPRSFLGFWQGVWQDVRFALRSMRKTPVFTAVAVLSLAVGIGANSAIFSLINQLILRQLPVRDPQSLVLLAGKGRHYGGNNGRNALSYPMYQDLRDRNAVFNGIMCRYSMPFTVGTSSSVEVVGGELVSGNYFPVLGIHAALGRVLTAADDLNPGAHPYAVLSYAYWKSRFGGSEGVLGQTIRVNNYPLTIVGVSQEGFDGVEPGLPAQIRVPMMMTQNLRPAFVEMYNRRQRWVNVYGRLKPGITMERAKTGLQPLFHQIIQMEVGEPGFRNASPYAREQFLKMWMDAMPGGQGNTTLRRQYETPLWVLMGVVALVLLIACANLASLLTARAAARRKEIAIRLAMGSSRLRLIQQLLTECLLLALIGGAAGIGLSILLLKSLLGFLPINITGYSIASMPDGRVLVLTLAITLLAGLAFGLIPALQSTRPDLAETLKDQVSDAKGGGMQFGFRKLLVAFQVTLSLVLLIGAGIFIRSLTNLETQDAGFRSAGVLEFFLGTRSAGYDAERSRAFFQRVEDRLRAMPGVQATGIGDLAILNNNEWDMWVAVEGRPFRPGEIPDPHFNAVSPGYFDALGMRVIGGRDFDAHDNTSSPTVAIVNAKFVKKYFGGGQAVGKHIGVGGDPGTKTDIQVVGVVNDARYENLREEIPEIVYLCEMQRPITGANIYVRTAGDPRGTMTAVRSLIRELDPNLPITNLKTFDRQIAESLVTERLTATLATIFGMLATALVLIGLYGVMSFMVTRRSREIGIRMALGAFAGSVVWIIMREALILIATGIVIGLPAAWALSRVVRAQLYGVEPGDPMSIALATVLLGAVTAIAAFIPARRAAGFDPWRILRHE